MWLYSFMTNILIFTKLPNPIRETWDINIFGMKYYLFSFFIFSIFLLNLEDQNLQNVKPPKRKLGSFVQHYSFKFRTLGYTVHSYRVIQYIIHYTGLYRTLYRVIHFIIQGYTVHSYWV